MKELVAQVKQSTYPDWNVNIDRFLLEFATRFLAAYTAQQEPVAKVADLFALKESCTITPAPPVGTKLYATPVAPADMAMVSRTVTEDARCVLATPGNYRTYQDQWTALIAAVGEVKL